MNTFLNLIYPINITKIIDLKKIVGLRKAKVAIKRTSVCYVIENLAERGIHCLPCSHTADGINMLP